MLSPKPRFSQRGRATSATASLALLLLSLGQPSAGFEVTGLYRWPSDTFPPVCGLFRVSSTTGEMTLVANTTACAGIGTTFPAFACRASADELAIAISTATSVSAVDLRTGATRVLAPMPSNSSDTLLGFVSAGGRALLVTQSSLFEVRGGALTALATDFAFPELAIVAARDGAGTGGAPLLYVASEEGSKIFVIDVGATPPAVTATVTMGASSPWDMLYDAARTRLLVLAGYRLYAVDPQTGKTTTLMNIPDGPGYPKVYGLSPDGAIFYFFDFTFIYTIDLATNKVVDKAPFTASPRTIGLPGPIFVQ